MGVVSEWEVEVWDQELFLGVVVHLEVLIVVSPSKPGWVDAPFWFPLFPVATHT